MARDPELNRKSFLFTASDRRAEAIELAAENYPDEQIKAHVSPVDNKMDALAAFARVKGRGLRRNERITEEDWAKVEKRFLKMGESGTRSLVQLDVPEGAQNFDFKGFYEEVDSLMAE